jgi:hypothetical protein
MGRYVDAATAAEMISERCNIYLADLVDVFAEIPSADVVEVVHGEWIPIPKHENKRCSVCRTVFSDFTLGYYCPKCGAKMDGGSK